MSLPAEAEGCGAPLQERLIWPAILISTMSLTAMAAALIVA